MDLKVVVVMPAYNAAATLEKTVRDIPQGLAEHIVLVDDSSKDATVEIAKALGLRVIVHNRNRGYGANQKTL
jgi:glycosyltransferase involved in cell wall biosynthesis